ncbi:hypothetical protein EXE51_08440 [Halorubrum sp. CGM5_25_10-8B]|uniref:hypothetical protein n=1 Tax=Halorubrum sp. CGM5_25_10-8B TaxID=2518115 RepID=UPI0010F805D2|nr:hypothetical protein [Halorubrum sp. CGM5_25_10-8B]TKX37087.1 hypothetical protein EXE51_08440 [Halorubrum sp. CGM5_25_10-8B]
MSEPSQNISSSEDFNKAKKPYSQQLLTTQENVHQVCAILSRFVAPETVEDQTEMPTTDTSSGAPSCTQIYDVVVVIALQDTDRELADEFVAARDVRELNPATIEVTQNVVARTDHEAYRCGVNLIRAILDAAGLVDQYSLGDVRPEVAR